MKNFFWFIIFLTGAHIQAAQYTNVDECIQHLQGNGFRISLDPTAGTEAEQVAQEDERIITHCLRKFKTVELYDERKLGGDHIPLVTACANNHPTIVRYMIHIGLPPMDAFERRYVREAAHAAVTKKHFDTLSLLLPHLSVSEIIEETRGKSLFSFVSDAAQPHLLKPMLDKKLLFSFLEKQREKLKSLTFLECALKKPENQQEYEHLSVMLALNTNSRRLPNRDAQRIQKN